MSKRNSIRELKQASTTSRMQRWTRVLAGLVPLILIFACLKHHQPSPAADEAIEPAVESPGNADNLPLPAPAEDGGTFTPPRSLAQLDPATQGLISQLMNDSLPLKSRCQAAQALAKVQSADALTALKAALQNSPPYLTAAVAESLGQSSDAAAYAWLVELAKGSDEVAARGAVRGLARRQDTDSVELLGSILFDSQNADSVRTEAALGLGVIEQPEALALLTRGANEIQDNAISEYILLGLGKRPFTETATFFADYLGSPAIPADAKVAALEALSDAEGEVGSFLLQYLSEPNPQLRAAAAWSLSACDNPSDLGAQLGVLLSQETDPEVRRRLYQALANQQSCDWPSVAALARSESEPSARLAALDLLAGLCHSAPSAELLDFFHGTALTEIKEAALTSNSPEDRLSAAIILRRAGTPESFVLLQELAGLSNDSKVIEAARMALRVQVRQ